MSAAGELEFVILGCGSSGGVPRGDGDWGDCDPAEPRNYRTRCSLLAGGCPAHRLPRNAPPAAHAGTLTPAPRGRHPCDR